MNEPSGQIVRRRGLAGLSPGGSAAHRRRSRQRVRRGFRLEALEDRMLLAATLDISALNALVYTGSGVDNDLTISVSGGVTTFHDPSETITVSNLSGLTVTPIDANTVTVSNGLASIAVNTGAGNDTTSVLSINAPTTVDLGGGTFNWANVGWSPSTIPETLAGILASLSVSGSSGQNTVSIKDTDNTADVAFTIAPGSITGLTPSPILIGSGVTDLGVSPGTGTNTITVDDTLSGATTINTPVGGAGSIQVNATTGSLQVNNNGDYSLILGDGDVTKLVGAISASGHLPYLEINDSSSTADHVLELSGTSTSAVLSGFPDALTDLPLNPTQIDTLYIRTGTGVDSMTVDFRNGNPLPAGVPAILTADNLFFNGGGGGDSLILLGDPAELNNFAFSDEIYDATGPGEGKITLRRSGNIVRTIGFEDLAPVQDSTVAATYILNIVNPASHEIGLSDATIPPGSTAALLIADSTGAASFESAAIANKTNVVINVNPLNASGLAAENDFTINNPTLPAGLATLTVNGGSTHDQFHVIATTPNVVTNLNGVDGNDAYYVTGSGLGAGGTLNANGGTSFDELNIASSGANPVITPAGGGTGSGTINGVGGGLGAVFNYSRIETINLTKPALPVTASTSQTVSAVEHQAFTGLVVATFDAPTGPVGSVGDLNLSSHSFSATIDWGDSTSSPGSVVPNAAGGFSILGNHTYAAAGTYTTSVTITSLGSSGSTTLAGSSTILNVTSLGTTSATFAADPAPNVTVAASPLDPHAAQISGIDGIPLSPIATGVVVATFSDSGTIGVGTDYTATIDWGDGTPLGASTQIIATGTPDGTILSVYGNHTYAAVGVYPVTVTITKTASGAQTSVVSTATIVDASLLDVVPQPTVNAIAGQHFRGAVGSFVDTNPTPISLQDAARKFKVTIDWGDGWPQSTGFLTAVVATAAGRQYTIEADHTYESPFYHGFTGSLAQGPVNGVFPITIFVESHDGAAITLSNSATVTGLPVVVAGYLDPASDSGASHADGITNVAQPTFLGFANQGYVRVAVYATPAGGGAPILLGSATSDATGAWRLTSSVVLADGAYVVTAVAVDANEQIISDTATLTPNPIVIDTVGPKVSGLFFARIMGQVQVTYQDFGGVNNGGVGMNFATVVDANNYRLTKAHQRRRYLINAATVSPGTNAGPQTAYLSINNGKPLRGGHYVFSALSASGTNASGLQDVAGNALDGEYYGFLPSGNNVRGGDLVATLNAIHKTTYAPGTVVGSATPVNPPGSRPKKVILGRRSPAHPAQFRFVGRRAVHQGQPAKLHAAAQRFDGRR